MPKLVILDVGHGNCSIVCDENAAAVVDAPRGITVHNALKDLGVKVIHHLFISHADADHVAGVASLLTSEDVKVENVYVNPDPSKKTDSWQDFRYSAKDAAEKGTKIHATLNSTTPSEVSLTSCKITVLAPGVYEALGGVSGEDDSGRKMDSNTLSAVLMVASKSGHKVLLPGDMDFDSLSRMKKSNIDISCDTLVYPHHGGRTKGASNDDFVDLIFETVKPETIIFSNGRGKHDNPRPEVVKAITKKTNVKIACTQMSKKCASSTKELRPDHLSDISSYGRESKSCCAGTIVVNLGGDRSHLENFFRQHKIFIDEQVPNGLCVQQKES